MKGETRKSGIGERGDERKGETMDKCRLIDHKIMDPTNTLMASH